MNDYQVVKTKTLKRWSIFIDVQTYLIGALVICLGVMYVFLQSYRHDGIELRRNMCALCAVADRPPQWLWLGDEMR